MNLFKIVQNKTDKSNSKSSPYRDVGTVLLFVFLLPYVISSLWGHVGEETHILSGHDKEETDRIDERYEIALSGSFGIRKISMQEYLIRKLKIVLNEDNDEGVMYEFETLKAQAVVLRTQLWEVIYNAEDSFTIPDDVTMYAIKDTVREASDDFLSSESLYEKAVKETDGIYLEYENRPIKAAYFPVSNGHTRSASEVWGNLGYPYLISVECSQDIMADDYKSKVVVSKKEYCRVIQKIFKNDITSNEELNNVWNNVEFSYDSAGYVVKVTIGEYSCSGETFRNAFELSSSSLEAEWRDDEVIFHVKGVGHGFGMSQYAANERALSGETFDQILKFYFFQAELAKIE